MEKFNIPKSKLELLYKSIVNNKIPQKLREEKARGVSDTDINEMKSNFDKDVEEIMSKFKGRNAEERLKKWMESKGIIYRKSDDSENYEKVIYDRDLGDSKDGVIITLKPTSEN